MFQKQKWRQHCGTDAQNGAACVLTYEDVAHDGKCEVSADPARLLGTTRINGPTSGSAMSLSKTRGFWPSAMKTMGWSIMPSGHTRIDLT